ncbi:hypothetical protein DLAC_02142 [Tieghemostelium lacteum]|uniref:F-box domain-containing protein n=1 Tax=Tieghemostelium lacteum TaxID=361077 RepID=A0A152A456_TIELA|nr:hypothetical protein DLAC_02142 [Tieghemostelium lacteum]|eukprot:KYR01052.1 hypothetical protein DLAC_02142 [Tieghemostelium lacteum]
MSTSIPLPNIIITKILQYILNHTKTKHPDKEPAQLNIDFIKQYFFICKLWSNEILKKTISYKKISIYSNDYFDKYFRLYKIGFHNIKLISVFDQTEPSFEESIESLTILLHRFVKTRYYKTPLEFNYKDQIYQFRPKYVTFTMDNYLKDLKNHQVNLYERFPELQTLSIANSTAEIIENPETQLYNISKLSQVPESLYMFGFGSAINQQLTGMEVMKSWNGILKRLKITGFSVLSLKDIGVNIKHCHSLTRLTLEIKVNEDNQNVNMAFDIFSQLPNLYKLKYVPYTESNASISKFNQFIYDHSNIYSIRLVGLNLIDDGTQIVYGHSVDHKQSLKKLKLLNMEIPIENYDTKIIFESLDYISLLDSEMTTTIPKVNMRMNNVKTYLRPYSDDQLQNMVLDNPFNWSLQSLELQGRFNSGVLDILQRNIPTLKILKLSIFQITSEHYDDFIDALAVNNQITEFDIQVMFTEISLDFSIRLMEIILMKPHLTSLSIHFKVNIKGEYSNDTENRICEILKSHPNLHYYSISCIYSNTNRFDKIQSQIKLLHLD